MNNNHLPVDEIIHGDCIDILRQLPENCVDLIFADPPYNLQLRNDLYRPNMTRVAAVNDEWDHFSDFAEYDDFTGRWLTECHRVLKDTGTIWIIGTYHNIFRVGSILQDLGFWILNDVIWIKTNPMPNFRGVRFTNAHETLIWASKEKGARYEFDHRAMKSLNDELQMRSDWVLSTCNGNERIKINGKKAHSTQKPEALLYRVILSSSKPGDLILDPFFGTGTTGAVAKKLHRHWLGIEKNDQYVEIAQDRLAAVKAEPYHEHVFASQSASRRRPNVRFGSLLECGLLHPGQTLFFKGQQSITAIIKPDGSLIGDGFQGSIHQSGRQLSNGSPCNGWEQWYFENEQHELRQIDDLRKLFLNQKG